MHGQVEPYKPNEHVTDELTVLLICDNVREAEHYINRHYTYDFIEDLEFLNE